MCAWLQFQPRERQTGFSHFCMASSCLFVSWSWATVKCEVILLLLQALLLAKSPCAIQNISFLQQHYMLPSFGRPPWWKKLSLVAVAGPVKMGWATLDCGSWVSSMAHSLAHSLIHSLSQPCSLPEPSACLEKLQIATCHRSWKHLKSRILSPLLPKINYING